MTNFIKNFWADEEGATAIEYGLIAGLIAVALSTVLGSTSSALDGVFDKIVTELNKVTGKTTSGGGGGQ